MSASFMSPTRDNLVVVSATVPLEEEVGGDGVDVGGGGVGIICGVKITFLLKSFVSEH